MMKFVTSSRKKTIFFVSRSPSPTRTFSTFISIISHSNSANFLHVTHVQRIHCPRPGLRSGVMHVKHSSFSLHHFGMFRNAHFHSVHFAHMNGFKMLALLSSNNRLGPDRKLYRHLHLDYCTILTYQQTSGWQQYAFEYIFIQSTTV